MGREQRRAQRHEVSLPISLVLKDVKEDIVIAEPIMASVNDMSTYGLRITVPRIRVGNYHLFYSFNDNDTRQIQVEVVDPERAEKITIPAHPIWFDHIIAEHTKPFQVGLEFLIAPNSEEILRLHAIVKSIAKPSGGWFKKFFGLG